jgi:hypothetical protein
MENHGGVVAQIKEVAPEATFVHCSINQEALAAKKNTDHFITVLTEDKVVKFIKSTAMNSQLFSILCNKIGSEYDKRLLHIEVRWLSPRNLLSCLFELH